jgi:DNA repair protein RadC
MYDTTTNLVSCLRDGDRIDHLGAEGDAILEAARRVLAERHKPGTKLESPHAAGMLVQMLIGASPREEFLVVFLDTRLSVIATEIVATGTIDGARVYPREIVRRCIELNAAACLFGHNHPSNVLEPSSADRLLTQRLKDALRLIDVRVLDHLIVGPSGAPAVSMADRGWV